jgi:hypothetical protein
VVLSWRFCETDRPGSTNSNAALRAKESSDVQIYGDKHAEKLETGDGE